jgi:phage regulator Rha-like protein
VKELIPAEQIQRKIYLIRGQKVMLDSELAELYGVATKVLVQAVKRNLKSFPSDFMFQLNNQEVRDLRSQIVTSKTGRGGRRYLPYAFTEQGVAMLSSVLNSERAVQVNIAIMRTFVKLREMLSANKELAHKLSQLERKIEKHDEEIKLIFDAIRQLMSPPEPKKKKIGFKREKEK